MKYVKPDFYQEFHCLAGSCPDTCCAGWQIAIDEESLERYERVKGSFGEHLNDAIDWEEGSFVRSCGQCSLLNEEKLCGLYLELGEGSLCSTCREYPRHAEEFLNVRELSLGLSCPEAARLLLSRKEPIRFLEEVTEEEEELLEEFEDFDGELFEKLEEARTVMLRLLQNRSLLIKERMDAALVLALQLQLCLDEGREKDWGEILRSAHAAEEGDGENTAEQWADLRKASSESRYMKMCRTFTVFRRMETLREEWPEILEGTWDTLFAGGETAYDSLCRGFEECLENNGLLEREWSLMAENLVVFYCCLYLGGAVYDGWVYSKVALAVFAVRWIQEMVMARWVSRGGKMEENGSDILADYIDLTYHFAREMEHSDWNLETTEEWIQEHKF